MIYWKIAERLNLVISMKSQIFDAVSFYFSVNAALNLNTDILMCNYDCGKSGIFEGNVINLGRFNAENQILH